MNPETLSDMLYNPPSVDEQFAIVVRIATGEATEEEIAWARMQT